jgi:hypothetical protein
MTHDEKIAYFLRDMRQKLGLFGQFSAAPPIYRLLRRLGIKVTPPLFGSFWSLFWSYGVLYLGIILIVWSQGGHPGFVLSGVFAAAGGAIAAALVRRKARKLALPRWEDYPNP